MRIAILKTQAKSKILSPNISLKESSEEDSQISSNDETSLNNNIIGNFKNPLVSREQLNWKLGVI